MVVFTVVIFMASVWLLAIYLNNVLRQDMQQLLGDQQLSAATFVASDLNDDMEDRLRTLKGFADGLNPTLLDRKTDLQTMLEGRPFLQDLFNFGVIVVDVEGRVIADVPLWRARTDLNLMDRDYIATALQQGKLSVGRPVLGRRSGVPSINMAAPIRDKQGKVIGAVAGLINLREPSFMDHVSRHGYGRSGDVLLAARQPRIIITGSDQRRVMEQLPAAGIDPEVDARAAGRMGTEVFVNSKGVEVLSSAGAVPAAGWYVEISLPTEEAFSPIRDVQRRLLLTALLLTLLAGVMSWWMVRRQLWPMLEAVRALAQKREPGRRRQALPIRRDDEIGKLLSAFNAVTARLEQREALFRQILDTSSVAIFVVDTQGRITQANRRMAEMFGYSSRELVGREYVEMVQPSEREEARETMLALLASAIPEVNLDRLYWRADQTQFWGHLSSKRFVDADGLDKGLIGVIADITERKNAEEQLLRHDQRLNAIVENFPGGISMIDPELYLVSYNQQFKRLLDFPDALFEKPGLGLEDLFRFNAQRGEYGPGDVEQQVSERLERARKFEPHKFERVRPDGTVLEVQGELVSGGGFVTIYLDITERKQMEEEVRQLAFYDPLTKLPNRRLFNDRLTHSMAASKRSGCYGALMFLDLDNFKSLNDTQGHAAGDLLLIEAANRLKNCVRETDTVARLGGDEFVVVVDGLNEDKVESSELARVIAQKISASLAQPYRLLVEQDGAVARTVEHRSSASIGVVVFIESEGSQADFLKWADTAMYQAKGAGRSLIRFYEGSA
jgi:diguanylate cyclase (GGDEF)-like protein/PAS domain S-box-containing protein